MTPNLGQLGKYHILAEIGKGGFATVYRALDPTLDREVALKVLDPILARDPAWVSRFQREAKAVARLRHPHIVTIHEIGESEGRLYIAMELIGGPSLAERIAEHGRLPWGEALAILGQVAAALDDAHGQGVLHRDLKPANILLDPARGAILTDFGFARLVGESSMSVSLSGGVVGTPAYIAPEVWDGEEPTAQTDIYSLGCVAYEMLTGEVLFAGKTPSVVMRKHLIDGPQLPEQWPYGVSAGASDVLARALAKNPGMRYASADKFVTALAGSRLSGTAVSIPKPAPTPAPTATAGEERPVHVTSRPEPAPLATPPALWQRIGIELVTIPAGEFLYGDDNRRVNLLAYRIARTPVTNAQYREFVDATGHRPPGHWSGGQIPQGKEQHPVVTVSWDDAQAFCAWAGLRLPAEQEWEKAARGTDGREYPWGAWELGRCNSSEAKIDATTPVDRFPRGASPYGVLDAAGNVWEWCADYYGNNKISRVLRGGSFDYDARSVRCAVRFRSNPEVRYVGFGFRVVSFGL